MCTPIENLLACRSWSSRSCAAVTWTTYLALLPSSFFRLLFILLVQIPSSFPIPVILLLHPPVSPVPVVMDTIARMFLDQDNNFWGNRIPKQKQHHEEFVFRLLCFLINVPPQLTALPIHRGLSMLWINFMRHAVRVSCHSSVSRTNPHIFD